MTRPSNDILDAIQAGVIIIQADCRVEELNAAAHRFLDSRHAVGLPIGELFGRGHAVVDLALRVLETGRSASAGDLPIETRIGGPVLLDVTASPLRDENGTIDGAVLILRDRTLQKQLARLEAERERYEAFGHIAAGRAPEIKTPLAGIRGAGELLARRATDSRSRATAEMVVREATRIATLVEELMVFSGPGEIEPRPVNIHEILDGVIDVLSHDPLTEGVQTIRSYDPSLPEFLADFDRLTQVFLNLLRNAYQAVSAASTRQVEIQTRMTLDHRTAKSSQGSTPHLGVRIRDSGPGFSPAILRDATTPFVTDRAGGTGLGLAVAQHWINLHDGLLRLENRPSGGAEVYASVPLKRV